MLDMHPNETPELPDLSKPAMKFANAKYVMRSSLVLFIFVMKIEQGSQCKPTLRIICGRSFFY
jgi:hypothetical protein